MKIERLKRRDATSKELVLTNKVRVFGDREFLSIILKNGGCFIGNLAVYAREYEPPKYRCLQCGEIGHHKMEHCRKRPVCRRCGGPHLTRACPFKENDPAVKDSYLPDPAKNDSRTQPRKTRQPQTLTRREEDEIFRGQGRAGDWADEQPEEEDMPDESGMDSSSDETAHSRPNDKGTGASLEELLNKAITEALKAARTRSQNRKK